MKCKGDFESSNTVPLFAWDCADCAQYRQTVTFLPRSRVMGGFEKRNMLEF